MRSNQIHRAAAMIKSSVAAALVTLSIVLVSCDLADPQHWNKPAVPQVGSISYLQPVIVVDPAVSIGEVSAVYLQASNPGGMNYRWKMPHALLASGQSVEPLMLDDAITRAGGAEKLAAQLPHLERASRPAMRDLETAGRLTVVTLGILAPLLPLAAYESFANPDCDRLADGHFGCDAEHRCFANGKFTGPHLDEGRSLRGYLFFARAKYVSIEIMAENFDTERRAIAPWR